MNEERTAIINMALAGRLAAADAARVLDILWALEMDEAIAVEPPCGEPPWLEGVTDLNELVAASRWRALLPAASRQIARALAEADRRLLTMALGALDVMYLGAFPFRPDWTGYMLGGCALADQHGTLHRGGTSIWTTVWLSEEREPPLWDKPFALWLFSEPLPLDTATLEPKAVTTSCGTFRECVKLEYWVAPAPGGFVHGWGPRAAERSVGKSTVWLAPCVGPVRIVCDYEDGSTATIELSDYASAGGDSCFPLDAGNWWRFDRRDSGSVRRELWRALTAQPDGWVWLSVAGCAGRNV